MNKELEFELMFGHGKGYYMSLGVDVYVKRNAERVTENIWVEF
jgi:hypothetical protein